VRGPAAGAGASRHAHQEGGQVGPFEFDRYLVDQLIRPIANLYRVTPLAAGETPAGGPIAFGKSLLRSTWRVLAGDRPIGGMDRKFQLRDRYVLDLSGDLEKRLDRRLAIALAIGLDTLQNR